MKINKQICYCKSSIPNILHPLVINSIMVNFIFSDISKSLFLDKSNFVNLHRLPILSRREVKI